MTTVTQGEVIAVLGSVDDTLISQIIGTGADQAELAEAYAWHMGDEALINEGRPLPLGRVGSLIDILQAFDDGAPCR